MARISRLTKLKMNLDSITEDVGALPYERASFSNTDEKMYLHSSIHGFNADYKGLTGSINLSTVFKRLAKEVADVSVNNIQILREVADSFKTDICQGQEVENSDFGKILLGTNEGDPSVAALTADVKHVLSWYTFEDEVIRQLNEDFNPLHVRKVDTTQQRRDQFYTDVGDRIGAVLQQYVDKVQTSKITNSDVQKSIVIIQSLLNQASNNPSFFSDAIRSGELHRQLQNCKFANLLGHAYESTIEATINDCLQGVYTATRTGIQEKLADIIIHKKTYINNVTSPLYGAAIETGISAKLRIKNSFELKADLLFNDVQKRLEAELKGDAQRSLAVLAFIYNNYIALATWNTDMGSRRGMTMYVDKEGKKRRPSFRQRKQRLMGSNTSLGKFFEPLAKYINYLMLNTSFFGNRLDAGGVSLFDQRFFTNMYQNQKTGEATPPALLITSDHIYETWRVFQFYLNQVNGGELLFSTSQIFGDVFSGPRVYTVSELKKLYNLKCQYIAEGTGSIYNRLYDHKPSIMDSMPTQNAYQLMMAQTKGRQLKQKINLNIKY